MSTKNIEPVLKFLTQLGLDFYESKVFISLVDKGNLTVLQISRETKINRTGVYRIVERLKELGLAEEIINGKQRYIFAASLNKLELIVKEQESKAEMLRKILPDISNLIGVNGSTSQPGTRVQFYKGPEGVKQMVWNTLQAKTTIFGYTYRDLEELIGREFKMKWELEFVLRKLELRDIISDSYISSVRGNYQIPKNQPSNFKTKYISSKILNITHQVDLYNDVIAFYNWYDGEIFGVEIYNQKIVDMQKQMFEIVWDRAEEIKKI